MYVSPIKKFVAVRNAQELSSLSPDMDPDVARSEELFSDSWQSPELTVDTARQDRIGGVPVRRSSDQIDTEGIGLALRVDVEEFPHSRRQDRSQFRRLDPPQQGVRTFCGERRFQSDEPALRGECGRATKDGHAPRGINSARDWWLEGARIILCFGDVSGNT